MIDHKLTCSDSNRGNIVELRTMSETGQCLTALFLFMFFSRTAGFWVHDTSHEEDAAAYGVSDEVDERSVYVELYNRGPTKTTTTTTTRTSTDGRGAACLRAQHVHFDDRLVLDEPDVRITYGKTGQLCVWYCTGEDPVHSHVFQVVHQVDVLGQIELGQNHIHMLLRHFSGGFVERRQVEVVFEEQQTLFLVRANYVHRYVVILVRQLDDRATRTRDDAVSEQFRSTRHRHLARLDVPCVRQMEITVRLRLERLQPLVLERDGVHEH